MKPPGELVYRFVECCGSCKFFDTDETCWTSCSAGMSFANYSYVCKLYEREEIDKGLIGMDKNANPIKE